MKKEVVQELARKWAELSKEPECMDGSDEARESNAMEAGYRRGLKTCSEQLIAITEILG